MQPKSDLNRYVRLTETGARRLDSYRRRYRRTVEDIAADVHTPSINTVKRALRQGPVFGSTLERIWDYFQACAQENNERLPYLKDGEDYCYVEGAESPQQPARAPEQQAGGDESPEPALRVTGWISRSVPRPNRLFTGRRDVLDMLHHSLRAGPAAIIADPQALTGLGGIGKTQSAIAYIYEHFREYTRVFWISSETVDDLNDGLAGIAEELGLMGGSVDSKKAAILRVHEWFRSESGWLLVLDNADDVEALAPHFPHHFNGSLIITTRALNVVKWAAPIALQQFNRRDGATLLLRRAGALSVRDSLDTARESEVSMASALSETLAGLPLALDQAGAYIAQTGVGIGDYLERYRQGGVDLLDSVVDPEHASVTVTFRLAVEQMAQRTRCGPAALQMIRLCAFLAPDAIPEVVFTAFPFENPGLSPPDFETEVYAAVCGYSLASRNPQNRTVTVHRLVQAVTRDSLGIDERNRWALSAVCAVSDATPDFEYEDWPLCEMLLPQWRACVDHIRAAHIQSVQAAHLLYQSGRYLRARAMYAEAEQNLTHAAAIAEQVCGEDDPTTADYLDELACLYRILDRTAEARALHLRAIGVVERTLGPNHSQLASKLHNMAILYTSGEQYAEAEPILLRALGIYESQPARDERLIATTMTQLAGAYRCTGEFGQAERYCKRSLEVYESLFGAKHIDIATACNNLGLLYLTMGRLQDASAFYERALAMNVELRGDDHPETGNVLHGLARVRCRQGDLDEADRLYRRSIHVYEKQLGAANSRTMRLSSDYADFKRQYNRLSGPS